MLNIAYVWEKPPLAFFIIFKYAMKTLARPSFIRSHYSSRNHYFTLFAPHRKHGRYRRTVFDIVYLLTILFGCEFKRTMSSALLWLMLAQRVSNKIIINTRNWTWQGENKNNPYHEPWDYCRLLSSNFSRLRTCASVKGTYR